MKYLFLMFLLVVLGVLYLRAEQPKIWSDCLEALALPPNKAPVAKVPVAAAPVATVPIATAPVAAAPAPQTGQAAQPTSQEPTGYVIYTNVAAPTPQAFVPPAPLPAQPNWNWTVLFREYHNVVVTKVEADCVHITYDGGIGSINTSDLPPDLQKLFNYDPQVAAAAAKQKQAARAKIEAEEAPKIAAAAQQEKAQAATEEAQRIQNSQNIQNENATARVQTAKDQKSHIEADMRDMIGANEIYFDQMTGRPCGTAYWLGRYEADVQAIAKWDEVIKSGGK